MKRIILCADDYGQDSTISQAIIELFKDKHLSATSCIVTEHEWETAAKWLDPYKNTMDIGLHFNLTEGRPLSKEMALFYPLGELIMKSAFRQLDKQIIIAELRAQLDQFVTHMGQLPHFIDGHQHVHQFPVIRDALFEIYEERLRDNKSYLRCTYTPHSLFRFQNSAYFKQLIVQLSGGIAYKHELIKRNIPHNQSFAGFYHFANSIDYPDLFPTFVNQVGDLGLIMCHPGLFTSDESNPISTARHREYVYFATPPFQQYCRQKDIQLARFSIS